LKRRGLSVTTITNLEAAGAFALDHDFTVPQAQFDLANMSACAVNFLGNESRALPASELLTFRDVAASMDAESSGRGVEVGMQH